VNDAGGPETDAGAARLSRAVTISNRLGLHARAAARFVQAASAFDAEISVTRNDITVSGLSILGLMMLAAGPGEEIVIETRGRDMTEALEALSTLVARGFDEG
jgi:phosphocarrier protein